MLQYGASTGGRRQLSAACMSTQEIQEHQRGQPVHRSEAILPEFTYDRNTNGWKPDKVQADKKLIERTLTGVSTFFYFLKKKMNLTVFIFLKLNNLLIFNIKFFHESQRTNKSEQRYNLENWSRPEPKMHYEYYIWFYIMNVQNNIMY